MDRGSHTEDRAEISSAKQRKERNHDKQKKTSRTRSCARPGASCSLVRVDTSSDTLVIGAPHSDTNTPYGQFRGSAKGPRPGTGLDAGIGERFVYKGLRRSVARAMSSFSLPTSASMCVRFCGNKNRYCGVCHPPLVTAARCRLPLAACCCSYCCLPNPFLLPRRGSVPRGFNMARRRKRGSSSRLGRAAFSLDPYAKRATQGTHTHTHRVSERTVPPSLPSSRPDHLPIFRPVRIFLFQRRRGLRAPSSVSFARSLSPKQAHGREPAFRATTGACNLNPASSIAGLHAATMGNVRPKERVWN